VKTREDSGPFSETDLRMTQIASIPAETANKKLSKSSSQNYPNSFSENAKAPAPKASEVRKQFGERR
jgi:hypothetical protein